MHYLLCIFVDLLQHTSTRAIITTSTATTIPPPIPAPMNTIFAWIEWSVLLVPWVALSDASWSVARLQNTTKLNIITWHYVKMMKLFPLKEGMIWRTNDTGDTGILIGRDPGIGLNGQCNRSTIFSPYEPNLKARWVYYRYSTYLLLVYS